MSKHDDKIFKRRLRFEATGLDHTVQEIVGAYTLISSSKGFIGVAVGEEIKVMPVYDAVTVDSKFGLAAVELDGEMAILDIETDRLLTDFSYDRLEFLHTDHSVVLHKEGRKGVFSVASKTVVHEPVFVDISTDATSRLSWIYSPEEGYYIVDALSGRKVFLGYEIDECFDETHGHIFILRDGCIRMLTDDGTEDRAGYRALLASLGGRISLYNSVRHTSVVADIYGYIL